MTEIEEHLNKCKYNFEQRVEEGDREMGQQVVYGNPQAAYKQTAVETASPEKLLVMLYTGAIKFLRQAEKALEGCQENHCRFES